MFASCTSLATVVLHSGVTEIDNGAFVGCSSLASIYIPTSVTTINCEGRGDLFGGCPSTLVINCGAASEPAGWDWAWNYYGSKDSQYVTPNWGVAEP